MVEQNKGWKMLILGLTGQCNFTCSYCYAHEHPQESMSVDTGIQAIDMAAQSGKPFVLQFSGGEPLLAFDVMQKLVGYVHQKKIPAILQVQTNASLMERDMAIYLRNAKVGIGISLDGRPDQNDVYRKLPSGAGTSSLILRGAEILAQVGVEIGITCVVTDHNVRHLSGIVEMAYYLGNVRKIGFDLLRAQGRGVGIKAAGAEDLELALQEVLVRANHLEKQTGKKIIFSHRERVESLGAKHMTGFAHCHAMNGEAAFVDATGEMYACASLAGFPAFKLGNIHSSMDRLKQEKIGVLIQKSMEFCPRCSSFSLCGGACFARWYGANSAGNPYGPECMLKNVFIQEYQEGKR
ncbi:radical SAM protein [Pelosinus sp. sgz500959]|uniref:radical SAM protein n=1 Tax=Pelosinus sp. sgz500959 TaxID=3242472 RepID=UPI00367337BD